jgi:hypothetical protein
MNIDERITIEDGTTLVACHQDTDGSGEPLKCNSCYFLKHKNLKCPDCSFTGQTWYNDWHVIFKTVEEYNEDYKRAMSMRDDEDPRTYW